MSVARAPELLIELLTEAARTPGGHMGLLRLFEVAQILVATATGSRRMPRISEAFGFRTATNGACAAWRRQRHLGLDDDAVDPPLTSSSASPRRRASARQLAYPPARQVLADRPRHAGNYRQGGSHGSPDPGRLTSTRTRTASHVLRANDRLRPSRARALGTDREGWTPGRALVALRTASRRSAPAPGRGHRIRASGTIIPPSGCSPPGWLEDDMLEWRPARSQTSSGAWRATCCPTSARTSVDVRHPEGHRGEDDLLKESRDLRSPRSRRGRARRAQHAAAAVANESINNAWHCSVASSTTPSSAATCATTRRGGCAACATIAPAARCSSPTRSARCSRPPTAWTDAPPVSPTRCCRSPNYASGGPGHGDRRAAVDLDLDGALPPVGATSRPVIRSRSFASGCGCCVPPDCASTRPAEPAAATST